MSVSPIFTRVARGYEVAQGGAALCDASSICRSCADDTDDGVRLEDGFCPRCGDMGKDDYEDEFDELEKREAELRDLPLAIIKDGIFTIAQELPELREPALSDAALWMKAYVQQLQERGAHLELLQDELSRVEEEADFCHPGVCDYYDQLLSELPRTASSAIAEEEELEEERDDSAEVLRADLARARRDYHAHLMSEDLDAPGVMRMLDNLKDTIEDLEREIAYRDGEESE